LLNQW